MPSNPVWKEEGSPAATSTPVATIERPSIDKFTTTTADPGSGGTTLAVTDNALFPATNGYRVRVIGSSGIAEIMLVTGGAGTNSWTVTRGQDGTTGVAHSISATVSLVEAVQVVTNQDAHRVVSYKGRVATFRTTGRAGTAGQKLFAIHNATGSTVHVDINRLKIDVVNTAVRAITVEPVLIRLWKFTAVPTNGTALTKVAKDSTLFSDSAVTVWGDASADKVLSGTALTVTLPAGQCFTQEYGPRNFTAVGQEAADKITFLEDESDVMTLHALEGVCVFLDYATATFNPATDFWTCTCDWEEYQIA